MEFMQGGVRVSVSYIEHVSGSRQSRDPPRLFLRGLREACDSLQI